MTYATLDVARPIWDRFLWVSPLVVVGTVEEGGGIDLAPKHMATPLGWDNYFGFVCTPRHATYRNALREGSFAVSYPTPDQLVHASLAAEPRCDTGEKVAMAALPTVSGDRVPAPLLRDAYLHLECALERIVDGFGVNALIVGRIVAARVREDALRHTERSDQELIATSPLIAYLPPGQYAHIDATHDFPLPEGFTR